MRPKTKRELSHSLMTKALIPTENSKHQLTTPKRHHNRRLHHDCGQHTSSGIGIHVKSFQTRINTNKQVQINYILLQFNMRFNITLTSLVLIILY